MIGWERQVPFSISQIERTSNCLELPPTPNDCVCKAMRNSLTCATTISNPQASTIAPAMASVCGMLSSYSADGCSEISSSAGLYGRYSFCSELDKLSYIMNQYVTLSGGSCDFRGSAKSVRPKNKIEAVDRCDNSTEEVVKNKGVDDTHDKNGAVSHSVSWAVAILLSVVLIAF